MPFGGHFIFHLLNCSQETPNHRHQHTTLQLVTGLSHKQTTDSQSRQKLITDHHHEHRGPPGVRVESAALHPDDP